MPRSEIVARLLKLDTCAVSDAMDQLGLTGVAQGIRPLSVMARVAGQVVTVKLKMKGTEQSTRHLGTAAIEAAAPGDVIVVEHPGREDAAGWGGILSNAAKVKGVAGVVVDGPCRDIDESRELGFPVFGKSTTPMTARGRIVEESFNEPVTIAGISVQPGDYLLADGSGVVVIPADRAEDVLNSAESIASREAALTRAVLSGQSVVDVMGGNYENMLSRTAP